MDPDKHSLLYSDLQEAGINLKLQHTPVHAGRIHQEEVVLRTSSRVKSIRRDPTLLHETIRVRVEFRILAPIYIPQTNKIIQPENKKDLQKYIDYVCQRTNENLNAYGQEFDNADFLRDRLFSVEINSSKQKAVRHQLIYLKHLLMLIRPNVEIFVENFEKDVIYDPFYDGFNSKEFHSQIKKIFDSKQSFSNSLDQVRNLIDPTLKGHERGYPASNPLRKLCIWVADFPQRLSNLEGYGTFPWDEKAGTEFDGVVLNAGNMQWDPNMMENADFAGFKTIAHELCHTIGGLPHTFENNGILSDVPDQFKESKGHNYDLDDWPQVNGQYQCIIDLMDYEVDEEMQGLTHDQGILLRKVLTLHTLRKELTQRVPTPENSPWIAPFVFNHYIPDQVLDWDLEDLVNSVDIHGRTPFQYNPYQKNQKSRHLHSHSRSTETSFPPNNNSNSRNWTHAFDQRVNQNQNQNQSAFRFIEIKEDPPKKTKTNWIERVVNSLKKWKQNSSCSSWIN